MLVEDKYITKIKPDGHSSISIILIEKYIVLTPLEKTIIRFHMGYYSAKEFGYYYEYTLKDLCAAQNNRIVKLFHYCDDLNSAFDKGNE